MLPFAAPSICKDGVAVVPWTPDLASPYAWWDPAYGRTNTSGPRLKTWQDRITGRTLANSSDSFNPYAATSINGYPLCLGDGSDDYLECAYTHTGSEFTLACVMRYEGAGDYGMSFGRIISIGNSGFSDDTTDARAIVVRRESGGTTDPPTTVTRNGQPAAGSVAFPGNFTPMIVVGRWDASGAEVWINGTSVATGTSPGTAFNMNKLSLFRATRSSVGFSYGRASIYDLATFHSALGTSNRQKMEGYLAHKYSMTANLPSGHPYKTVAPTV